MVSPYFAQSSLSLIIIISSLHEALYFYCKGECPALIRPGCTTLASRHVQHPKQGLLQWNLFSADGDNSVLVQLHILGASLYSVLAVVTTCCPHRFHCSMLQKCKAIANDLVGQVLVGPLFLKVLNKIPFYKKANNKQKCQGNFWTCSACYIIIQQIEKAYDEVESNQPPITHAKYCMLHNLFSKYCAKTK